MKSARKMPRLAALIFVTMLAAAHFQPALAQKTMSTGAGSNSRITYADYSLKLVFALRSGPYVADVAVTIFDESGAKVVNAHSDGPWFLAQLPPGNYRVVARRKGGQATAAMATITAGHQKRVFLTW